MRGKTKQLTAIFNDLSATDESATIIMMVASKKKDTGGFFSAVSGDGVQIAADLTLLMHQAPEFAKTVKMALVGYESGPKPPKSLFLENRAEELTPAPAEEPEPTGDQLTREEVRDMIKTAFLGALDEAFAESKE